ncbi:hypothetical protein [Streptomyces sp. NPDC057428]|uniref:hypothetical protein n=1 Tax=Streptomyces sp. NPDC057428 TaxID=3346129 RepID=UPI0036883938
MPVRPLLPRIAAAALFASLLATGCSSGGSSEAKSENKDMNDNASKVSAQAKCADLLPDEASAAPALSAFVAKVRKFSACVHENGFPEYPDPDPTSGQVDATVNQAEKYHTPDFVVAVKKCSPA